MFVMDLIIFANVTTIVCVVCTKLGLCNGSGAGCMLLRSWFCTFMAVKGKPVACVCFMAVEGKPVACIRVMAVEGKPIACVMVLKGKPIACTIFMVLFKGQPLAFEQYSGCTARLPFLRRMVLFFIPTIQEPLTGGRTSCRGMTFIF